ncbi:MAG: flagellar hook-basal body complex protein FliE [Oligoflexia bacterium]|nr:flagellar hook-basal body complex protein FliE [Oligoflexia bacterium]
MIRSVGEVSNLLNSYNTKDWVTNGEMKIPNVYPSNIQERVGINGDNNNIELESKKTFGNFLADSLTKVNNLQKEANVAIEKLVSGGSENLHETMLLVEQAEIAFKTLNQLRQKVLDAYKEVMKMQI